MHANCMHFELGSLRSGWVQFLLHTAGLIQKREMTLRIYFMACVGWPLSLRECPSPNRGLGVQLVFLRDNVHSRVFRDRQIYNATRKIPCFVLRLSWFEKFSLIDVPLSKQLLVQAVSHVKYPSSEEVGLCFKGYM